MFNKGHKKVIDHKLPQLINISQYAAWKEQFEVYVKHQDACMWRCIVDGYFPAIREIEGRKIVISFDKMNEFEKQMYNADKQASTVIRKSLPIEIKHSFHRYGSSSELWEALKKRYHSFSRQSTCETASADCGSSNDKSSGQAFVAEKVGAADDVAKVAEARDNSGTVSHSCSNCNDLQVNVDTLSEQNQKLMAEGTKLLSMLKSYEQEISSLKSKVNDLS